MGAGASRNGGSKNYQLQELYEHEGGINCAALSEDGSVLATGGEDRTACIWSTKTARTECIGILKGHEDYINAITIEENFVITGSADKSIRKWDMSTCECVHIFRGHNSIINRLLCTGDFIFSASYDRTVRCWDFDSGECIRVFSGHKLGVYPMIFIPGEDQDEGDYGGWTPNSDVLVSGSADFTVRIWSFESGKSLHTLKGHSGGITCMATDGGGKILFTGSTDKTIMSWDINKGTAIRTFEGHQGTVICISVVNKIMYSGSADSTARSWVTEFGDCTKIYKGHNHTVTCLKYHQDGFLFTGCGDGIARAFDSKSANLKRQYKGHTGAINTVQIVDDKLLTASHDGSLRVWEASNIREEKNEEKEQNNNEEDKMQEEV